MEQHKKLNATFRAWQRIQVFKFFENTLCQYEVAKARDFLLETKTEGDQLMVSCFWGPAIVVPQKNPRSQAAGTSSLICCFAFTLLRQGVCVLVLFSLRV
jgi:hypothetical protein